MFNDRQREFVNDLLDEFISRIDGLKGMPDRVNDLIGDELRLAASVKRALAPPPPADPELERLVQEEEEIEAFTIFQRELQLLGPGLPTISFQSWRNSPLNPVKRGE